MNSELEKMRQYIKRNPIPRNPHFTIPSEDVSLIAEELTGVEAVLFALRYGRAKGYRQGKAEKEPQE